MEDSRDLGFGFRQDVIAETTVNRSESIGHFVYLFYRDRRLSQTDNCAVAPSGAAIVYQGGPSGNIFVFRRNRGTITQLTASFPGLVKKFKWRENARSVMALVDDSRKRTRWLTLPIREGL